jgi:dimethylamine/trimethylamine dehydrogenase
VVFDADGYFMGVGMAEKLAREGRAVTYLTPFETIAPYLHLTLEGPRVNRLLRELGVEVVTEHALTSIRPGSASAVDVWTFVQERTFEADSVVLVTQRNANDALYRELKADPEALRAAGIAGLYQVGDCLLPGLIADAVYSGHRLAREIDSPDPATPLPYVRERRLLHASESDYELGSETLVGETPAHA